MEPVIVIHGTFANEASWWRPEGDFCKLLNNHLKVIGSAAKCWDSIKEDAIGEYGWSGLNSEASRTHAAQILTKKILELSALEAVEKIHFVAHSHGGNVLIKSLMLVRGRIAKEKLGCFVFLGTPFFSYGSLAPRSLWMSKLLLDSELWRRAEVALEKVKSPWKGYSQHYSRTYGGTFFSINSTNDEAFQVLQHCVQLRTLALTYSRKWTQKSRAGVSPQAR
jgi:hypothetical protein